MNQVRVWQSYSCNNSSAYRVVARFESATKAAEVAAELQALRGEQPGLEPTALADAVGFVWDDFFPYGDEDDPTLVAEGNVVAVYHSYCLGFPEEFASWLKARGGEVEPQGSQAPQVSVLFALPEHSAELQAELVTAFAPRPTEERTPVQLPWSDIAHWARTAFFCDGHTVGFTAPVVPGDLPLLKRWLSERGVVRPSIRLCEYDDEAKFRTLARARCSACEGSLRYLEPKRFGLDDEQLACDACGAMYELSAIRAAHEVKP